MTATDFAGIWAQLEYLPLPRPYWRVIHNGRDESRQAAHSRSFRGKTRAGYLSLPRTSAILRRGGVLHLMEPAGYLPLDVLPEPKPLGEQWREVSTVLALAHHGASEDIALKPGMATTVHVLSGRLADGHGPGDRIVVEPAAPYCLTTASDATWSRTDWLVPPAVDTARTELGGLITELLEHDLAAWYRAAPEANAQIILDTLANGRAVQEP